VPLGGAAHPARLSTLPPLRLRETPSETPLHEHPTRLPPTRRVGNVLSLSPTASGVFPSSSRTIVYTSSSVCSVRPTKSTCSSWPVAVHVFSGHTCRAISAGDQRGLTPGVLPRNRRAATSGSCANVSSVTCDSHARTYLPPLLTSVALGHSGWCHARQLSKGHRPGGAHKSTNGTLRVVQVWQFWRWRHFQR
jgi:hypothetical protein